MRIALKPAIGATMIALAAMSGAASAAPLNTLYFTQSSVYDPDSISFNNSQGLVPLLASPSKFQWTSTLSNPDATSSLEIVSYDSSNAAAQTGDTNLNGLWNANEWFRIDQLIQHNEVLAVPGNVANPNPLWSASILGTFAVYQNSDFSGALLPGGSDTTTTSLRYWETTNEDDLDECAGPTPLGSECDDEYTVLALSLAPLTFSLDGWLYKIDFQLEPGDGTIVCVKGALSPACTAAGVTFDADELMKVYAAEQEESNLFVAARWTATQIPEPGILGLLGIGLVGMGMSARRRKATA